MSDLVEHIANALKSVEVVTAPNEIKVATKPLTFELRAIRDKCGVICDPSLERLLSVSDPAKRGHLACRRLFADVASSLLPKKLNLAKWSLSHSQRRSSIAYSFDQSIASIGLDIEPLNRIIESRSERFFLHSSDQFFSSTSLVKWMVKEAALKCLDRFRHKMYLSDIVVEQVQPDYFFCKVKTDACWAHTVRLPHEHCAVTAVRLAY